MKMLLKLAMPLVAIFGLGGCDYLGSFPKDIREFPEPWQVLETGKPLEKPPRVEIVTRGGGATIEPGDFVQFSLKTTWAPENVWKEHGDWWLWIGFLDKESTAFFVDERLLASALVGQRQGSVLAFKDNGNNPGRDAHIVAGLNLNPIGDLAYYNWRKSSHGTSRTVYVSGHETPSTVEIKRVCKGQARYRTLRLFDDSPVQICSGVNCRVSTEAREAWVDEARIDAVCQDGKKVYFQYGPIDSRNGKPGRSPKRGYFDEWFHAAWSKIPEGVQFERNHAPEVKMSHVTTKTGMPVKIDFLANARDADGDKLTMRIDSPPQHGKLATNPDGSLTYTPEAGWFGVEPVSYHVSDGMAEKGGQVEIEVVQSAW